MRIAKITIYLVIFLSLFVLGCQKTEETIDCQKKSEGTIRLKNTSNDPYLVEITTNGTANKVTLTIDANTSGSQNYGSGNVQIVATQKSGYLLTPTVRNFNSTLATCGEYSVSFP